MNAHGHADLVQHKGQLSDGILEEAVTCMQRPVAGSNAAMQCDGVEAALC